MGRKRRSIDSEMNYNELKNEVNSENNVEIDSGKSSKKRSKTKCKSLNRLAEYSVAELAVVPVAIVENSIETQFNSSEVKISSKKLKKLQNRKLLIESVEIELSALKPSGHRDVKELSEIVERQSKKAKRKQLQGSFTENVELVSENEPCFELVSNNKELNKDKSNERKNKRHHKAIAMGEYECEAQRSTDVNNAALEYSSEFTSVGCDNKANKKRTKTRDNYEYEDASVAIVTIVNESKKKKKNKKTKKRKRSVSPNDVGSLGLEEISVNTGPSERCKKINKCADIENVDITGDEPIVEENKIETKRKKSKKHRKRSLEVSTGEIDGLKSEIIADNIELSERHKQDLHIRDVELISIAVVDKDAKKKNKKVSQLSSTVLVDLSRGNNKASLACEADKKVFSLVTQSVKTNTSIVNKLKIKTVSSVFDTAKDKNRDDLVSDKKGIECKYKPTSSLIDCHKSSICPSSSNVSNLGQWKDASIEGDGRKLKFFRLLGGFKDTSAPPSINLGNGHSSSASKFSSMAMAKNDVTKLNAALEGQFEKARNLMFNQQRGVGLGFGM